MAVESAEPSRFQFGLALDNQAAPTSLALSEAAWSKAATLTQGRSVSNHVIFISRIDRQNPNYFRGLAEE